MPKNENDRVIFIPQGSLFLVPFPALQDANRKYLIEKHTILTSPSIQVLDLTRKQREGIGTPTKEQGNQVHWWLISDLVPRYDKDEDRTVQLQSAKSTFMSDRAPYCGRNAFSKRK